MLTIAIPAPTGQVPPVLETESSRSLGAWRATENGTSGWMNGHLPTDPSENWHKDGLKLMARAEEVVANDGYAKALVKSIVDDALGPEGLCWRSDYQSAMDGVVSAEELTLRNSLESVIEAGWRGTLGDASGRFTRRQFQAMALKHTVESGDCWAVKHWLPWRQGQAQVLGTCWRLLHPGRVCNPQGGQDRALEGGGFLRGGCELNANGELVAIHVRSTLPGATLGPSWEWTRVAARDPYGYPLLSHLARYEHAEEYRPISWLTASLPLLHHAAGVREAYVVATRLSACLHAIVELPEGANSAAWQQAVATAKAYGGARGGAVIPGIKFQPGQTYFVPKGTSWKAFETKFQGEELRLFGEALLQGAAASVGLPHAYVLRDLTRSNMASSRTALLQVWATLQIVRADVAEFQRVLDESMLREAVARGQVRLPGENDLASLHRQATRGHYEGPGRLVPDPRAEAAYAESLAKLGAAPQDVLAAAGGPDWQSTTQRKRQDIDLAARHQVPLPAIYSDAAADKAPDVPSLPDIVNQFSDGVPHAA